MRVRMHRRIYGVIALFLSFAHMNHAWQTVACKDGLRSNNSFSFPVKTLHGLADVTYCYALEGGKSNEYALSFLKESENIIKPFAPEKIKLDGLKDQPNPLYNSGIRAITNIDDRNLLVVLNTHEPKVYGLSFVDETEVLTLASLTDACGKAVDQPICALAGSKTRAFVAVKGNGKQKFGEEGSGIALIAFERCEIEEEVSEQAYQELKKKAQEHDETALEEITQKITTDKDGKYRKKSVVKKVFQQNILSFTIEYINTTMNLNLCEIDDDVSLHWSESLKCLYVGLRVKSQESETAKALALFVCHLDEKNSLHLAPFFNTTLIDENQIIAGKGSSVCPSVHMIESMLTTTYLNYCIVIAGNKNCADAHSLVYAFPVMNLQAKDGFTAEEIHKQHGTLARLQAEPVECFSKKIKHLPLFEGRYLAQRYDGTQALMADKSAVLAGAGPLEAGPIDDIFVQEDAVHAVVNSSNSNKAGIYYSQAIFDNVGRIVAWTQWQPKALITDKDVMNATVMRTAGSLQIATTQDIQRTSWNKTEDNSLCGLVNKELNQAAGGIYEIIDFPMNTPGLATHSAVAILGSHKMMLADNNDPIKSITLREDLLEPIAPLATAEIVTDNKNGWLFIGGVHGLAIVSAGDGRGWKIDPNISFIDQLKEAVHFIPVGDCKFVRKIVADYPYVYILTDTHLDRISTDMSDFTTGLLQVTRLATISEFAKFGIFKDLIISEKFAVLATSDQLYRVGNGKDIRVDDQQSLHWTPVEIPAALAPVNCMIAVSVNGRMQDVARATAGLIYLVTGSPGKNVSQIHRFALKGVQHCAISDDTFTPLRDLNTETTFKPFANVGNYSSIFSTDGTFFFTQGISRRYKTKKEVLVHNFANYRSVMPLALDNDAKITCVARNSTLGNWMVGGNFGLFINE